jgi:hypothetical protein
VGPWYSTLETRPLRPAAPAALEVRAQQVGPARDRAPDEVGPDPEGVGIGDGRNPGHPFGRRPVRHFLSVRSRRVEDHGRGDPLLWRLAAVGKLTLGEKWKRLVPVLHLRDRDRLQHVAADDVAHVDEGAAAVAGAAAGSGALGGFPTIWAQNIKDIVLRHAGPPVTAIPRVAEQATKDLGFTVQMQAVENADLINRFLSQSNTMDCADVSP